MKKLILFLPLTLAAVLSSEAADACQPPPNAYSFQRVETTALFTDPQVDAKIFELAGRDGTVEAVTHAYGGYVLSLTSNCGFTAKPQWSEPLHPGRCPELEGFKIESEGCAP